MDDNITRLDRLLSRIQLLDPPYRESEEGRQVFQEICRLVFEEQLYASLWCEPTLNQLAYLFQTEKPDEELFGAELEELRKRTLEAHEVKLGSENNFRQVISKRTLTPGFEKASIATYTTISSRSSSATRGALFRPLSLERSTRPASLRLMMSS